MDKEQIKIALEELKKGKKRNFSQSYDIIINLRNLDLKQAPLDFIVNLPHPFGKKIKIAAFVDQLLREQAHKFCDLTIEEPDFIKYKDKKIAKKLAGEYDYFIAQATLMSKVAANFGKILGTKGKMPNPKLGCVVPPNANLEPLAKKLRLSVRLATKKGTNLQCLIGKDNQSEAEIIENILTVYQTVLKQVPNETHNIKSVLLKLTMSKPVKI
ncbi:MAG TPA: 50S ribosomal protein L1 [Candidatus Nanoarchaeia archaeon]|nr:50S ribosomal protein L1 [Candidatus Nanoarchaeia archaeon]